MQALKDRLSDWWAERVAVLEDGVEDRVVPPADRMLDRLTAWCATTSQQLKETPLFRSRNKTL